MKDKSIPDRCKAIQTPSLVLYTTTRVPIHMVQVYGLEYIANYQEALLFTVTHQQVSVHNTYLSLSFPRLVVSRQLDFLVEADLG